MQRLVILWLCSASVLFVAACAAPAITPTPEPAAGVILQKILTDCWGVAQLKELDGSRPDHARAFECARPRLLEMTRTFPEAAESHRLLAWGYYFSLQDEDAARAEYERAAEIYGTHAHPQEQAEMLVQLASIAFKYDPPRGCTLLLQALALDTTNPRASQLLRNFGCLVPTPAAPG